MKNMGQSEAERYRRAVREAEEDQKRREASMALMKRCDCGKPATYTFVTTFMGYLCDEHAWELQDEARAEPEKWQAECILLHSVEETDTERELRWMREDVLWDD